MPMTCPSRTLLIGEYVTGQGPYVKEIMENTNVCACAVYMLGKKQLAAWIRYFLNSGGKEGIHLPFGDSIRIQYRHA